MRKRLMMDVPGCALPHFIIIGAQRAGTTSLYDYLSAHRQIIPATAKEIHFFDLNYRKGSDWYRAHFPTKTAVDRRRGEVGGRILTGEASPFYMVHPHVPLRIKSLLPQIKLIALLRDPVARSYSHYLREVRKGREQYSFEEAIKRENERICADWKRLKSDRQFVSREVQRYSYKLRGRYLEHLMPYYDHFGSDKVLVLRSEDLYANVQESYSRILKFLELEPHTLTNARPRGRTKYDRGAIPFEESLRAYFEPHNRKLYAFLGRDFGW